MKDLDRLTAYEGDKPYIFVSYAHKNSDAVLPIIAAMQEAGFRVWFDRGIEAGTEWPEYIEEHLIACDKVLVFMSEATVSSVNCRNEINLTLSLKKECLIVYLEETELRHGMRLQLSAVQSLYAYRSGTDAFYRELFKAKLLQSCRETGGGAAPLPSASEGLEFRLHRDMDAVSRVMASVSFGFDVDPESYYVYKIGSCTDAEVVIPATYCGKSVTRIASGAFRNCKFLTGVTVPDGVEIINVGAFDGCAALRRVTIPKTVRGIGGALFEGCRDTVQVTIDPGNEAYCVYDGQIFTKDRKTLVCYVPKHTETSYAIPEGVTDVGDSAFAYCDFLTAVTIPKSVTGINNAAFSDCSALRSVTVPHGVTVISYSAFSCCTSLESVTIPSSVTRIESVAFAGCEALTSITIPHGVTDIDFHAFGDCNSLTSVTIPRSVTRIDDEAFSNCYALEDVFYTGTRAEWLRIIQGTDAFDEVPATVVHCADGDAPLCNE